MDDQLHKYRCCVRYLIQLRRQHGVTWFREYIYNPKHKKNLEPYLSDVWDQWIKGNRGEDGEWYE